MMTSPAIKAKIAPKLAPCWSREEAIGYVAYLGMGRMIPMMVANGIDNNGFFPSIVRVISVGI